MVTFSAQAEIEKQVKHVKNITNKQNKTSTNNYTKTSPTKSTKQQQQQKQQLKNTVITSGNVHGTPTHSASMVPSETGQNHNSKHT